MQSIIETTNGNIRVIQFNKPKKKNAFDADMYLRITSILRKAANDSDIIMVVLTGCKGFYSSGNDFSSKINKSTDNLSTILLEFIETFIKFPKLLVAIVEGAAIGIAATTLPLCDFVFAASDAYFYTPFTKLGIVAEGGSSITFPQLMGERKARQMLMLNYKMKAKEALECGLISHVYEPAKLHKKAWENINNLLKLSHNSLLTTKKLIRSPHLENLLMICKQEMNELVNISKSKL